MTDTTKMNCPECGSAMNHHAVKIEYDTEAATESCVRRCPEEHSHLSPLR